MEDALAREPNSIIGVIIKSLNPCCNGRCTRTLLCLLVKVGIGFVLILVVMEDALAQPRKKPLNKATDRLNPCCNGRCTRTQPLWPKWRRL